MIDKKTLESFKTTLGFNIWQIERDYLQHLFLLFLSRHAKDELVFKGGTALQKAYGLNRFSIDLDFTLNDKSFDITEAIKKITSDIKNFGYKAEIKEVKTIGKTFVIKINGPLFKDNIKSITNLRIEISLRENILLKPEIKEIIPVYPDLQPYQLVVMQLEEMLSEKIRTIVTRAKARDVYDLWFLLKKDIKLDTGLINKKLSYYNKHYNKNDLIREIKEKKGVWEKELKDLLIAVPDFEIVKKDMISKIG